MALLARGQANAPHRGAELVIASSGIEACAAALRAHQLSADVTLAACEALHSVAVASEAGAEAVAARDGCR
jgi:hypothetical protein